MKISRWIVSFIVIFSIAACAPYFKEISVNADRSDSKKSFYADCGDRIKVKWNVEWSENIGSILVRFLYTSYRPDKGWRVVEQSLDKDDREFEFTFNGPVTLQIIVRQNNEEKTAHSIKLKFVPKDYHFTVKLHREDVSYPLLGELDNKTFTLDLVNFSSFYDTAEDRVIDYVRDQQGVAVGQPINDVGRFRARTIPPLEELEENIFRTKTGYLYPYSDVNAVVFGGAFADFGEKIDIRGNKEELVEIRQSKSEDIVPVYLQVSLFDDGAWMSTGRSHPRIMDVQVGNLTQGLILFTYDLQDYEGRGEATIGSINLATITRQTPVKGIMKGDLKGSVTTLFITPLKRNPGLYKVKVEDARWLMPYLPDTDNLESTCGN